MKRAGAGTEQRLGPLEEAVLEVVWRTGSATPGEVKDALGPARELAYTTVMTVMSRLYAKGLLTRSKKGRAFSYSAPKSRADLLRERVSNAVRALSRADPQPAVSHFVDAASALDDDQLQALEREIARLREKRS